MSAIFVTATGTEIGKTFITAGLIRHLRASARSIDALKPVASGFDETAPEQSDTGVLLSALGRSVARPELDRISPWRFAAPLSPDMAARKEGRSLDFAKLVEFCGRAVTQASGTLLIEGIGGVMVPLDERHTVLDWIGALKVPAVLVTGSYLGSLSHTLTAMDALSRRNIAIKALVLNETPGSGVALGDTQATLSRFAAPVPVVTMPRLAAATQSHPAFATLAGLLEG